MRGAGEPAIGRVEVRGEAHVPIDQEAVETENLYFLCGFNAGGGLPHIVEFPPFRRAAVIERIALRVEMGLSNESRHQCDQQQHDEPGGVNNERGSKAHHSHNVLRLTEQLRHQRHPPAGLAAGALELILEIGVLKILQVESRSVLHQTDTRGVGHPLGKQTVDERDDAPENVGQNGHRKFGQEQNAQPVQQTAAQPLLECLGLIRCLHQQHNVIDNQLADVEGYDRKQRPQ